MSIIDTLITDRSTADTVALESLFAKAKAGTITEEEWAILANPAQKGAYNYTDLNRVISAMEYLRGRLEGYGYALKGYVQDTHVWQAEDNPKPAQTAQYLANVAAIRAALAVLPTTPAVPDDMNDLTVSEANAIEKILANVETVIKSMEQIFLHSGQVLVYSGFGLYFLSKAPSTLYVSGETLNMDDGASVSGEVLNLSIGAVSNETLTL